MALGKLENLGTITCIEAMVIGKGEMLHLDAHGFEMTK